MLPCRQPGGDELHELASIADHADRPVTGIRNLGSEVDDALQHHRQRQLRREGEARLEQYVLAVRRAPHRWRIYAHWPQLYVTRPRVLSLPGPGPTNRRP